MEEARRLMRGEATLRGVVLGEGLGKGLCTWDANLQGGAWGELRLVAGGVRAVSLRGVKPGEVKAGFRGKTIDKDGDILLIFWGHVITGEGGVGVEGEGAEERGDWRITRMGDGVEGEGEEREEMAIDAFGLEGVARRAESGELPRPVPASPFCRSRASVRRRMSL